MRYWKLLIILGSGAAALAVGLGSHPPTRDLFALINSVINAIT
jgi:hypothetical protein